MQKTTVWWDIAVRQSESILSHPKNAPRQSTIAPRPHDALPCLRVIVLMLVLVLVLVLVLFLALMLAPDLGLVLALVFVLVLALA